MTIYAKGETMHTIRDNKGVAKVRISDRIFKRFLPEMEGEFGERNEKDGKVRIFRITQDAVLGVGNKDVEVALWVGDYIEL